MDMHVSMIQLNVALKLYVDSIALSLEDTTLLGHNRYCLGNTCLIKGGKLWHFWSIEIGERINATM